MRLIMWHNITWRADWGLCNSRTASAFPLLVIMTLQFQRGLPALHQPGDITDTRLRREPLTLCEWVCVWKNRRGGRAESSSDRLAQQIACQRLIRKNFQAIPVMCSTVSCAPYPGPVAVSLDLNSMKTLDDTPLAINPIFQELCKKYKRCVLINCAKFVCMLQAVTWLWEVSWGTNLSIRPLRICEKGSSVDEWTRSCWQRQKPVQRERRGLLFSTEPRWHWGHRGQYDPCDLHVMPLLQPQLLKVRTQLAKISRNEKKKKKKKEQTYTSGSKKENTFLLTAIHMYLDFANS